MDFEDRYSRYEPDRQEIVMLMGRGCFWKKCTFCDYHLDYGPDSVSIPLDHRVLDRVSGEFGSLVVLNSGSFFELPAEIQSRVIAVCREKQIKDLYLESHWLLHRRVAAFRDELKDMGITLHGRIGIETFDADFREDVMKKGMGKDIKPEEIAEIFDECCLLFGLKGQSVLQFKKDIKTAEKYFDRVYLNLFNPNSTACDADPELVSWFVDHADELAKRPKLRVLIENTALGVGD